MRLMRWRDERAPSARQIQLAADVQSLRLQITAIAPGRPQPTFVGALTNSSVSQMRRELGLAQADMAVRGSLPVGSRFSLQGQSEHISGSPRYTGQSYFQNGADALQVLNAYHSGAGQVLGMHARSNNQVLFRYYGVTGTYHNPGFNGLPPISMQTNVFMLKGTNGVVVVPVNPAKGP